MNNFKGTILAKRNVKCQHCTRIVGPNYPIKMLYIQYGAGAGSFCSNTCAKAAYDIVTKANPQFKTKQEVVFRALK